MTGKPAGTALASSGFATDRQWYVEAWHTGINPKNQTVTAWGVCTDRVAKVTVVSSSQPVPAAPAGANETAECAEGHATGGGARLIGAASNWWLNSTGGIDTSSADDEVPDDGWVTWVEHTAGAPSTMITDVVCMEGKLPTYRDKEKESSEVEKVAKKVFCPDGKSATGGGAFASGATNDAHVTSTAPIDSKKDSDKVPDDGWQAKFFNDNGTEQTFTASVVCR